MFGMGTEMSLKDFAGVIKSPKGVVVGVAAQFIIMPLIGFTLATITNFPSRSGGGNCIDWLRAQRTGFQRNGLPGQSKSCLVCYDHFYRHPTGAADDAAAHEIAGRRYGRNSIGKNDVGDREDDHHPHRRGSYFQQTARG